MPDGRTDNKGLSAQEIQDQQATDLPDREAMSLLDLNADINLALDLAAPIDAAVAANANAAIPVDGAVSANLLSLDSQSLATAPQTSVVQQSLTGEATATGTQGAAVDQDGS